MMADQIADRLHTVSLLPAVRTALQQMAAQDDIFGRRNWGFIIPGVAQALGAADLTLLQPFAAAWGTLNAVLRHFDHLQDEDTDRAPLPTIPARGAHYNLLLCYFVLASALLDDLDQRTIPASRLLQLRRLWADCLLRVGSGQQADLETSRDAFAGLAALEHYQQIVQAKTGALFALAFGGTATLLSDDPATVAALSLAGEVYGMLVQYSDDVVDADGQANAAMTLPHAYAASRAQFNGRLPKHDASNFWRHVYTTYLHHVQQTLAVLPASVQTGIVGLFTITFEGKQHHMES